MARMALFRCVWPQVPDERGVLAHADGELVAVDAPARQASA
jgi:hypothetical protein